MLRVGGYPSKKIAQLIASIAQAVAASHRRLHHCLLLFSLLTIAIAGSTAQASSNLLTNGGFEAAGGWTSLSIGAGVERSSNIVAYGVPPSPEGTFFCEVEGNPLSPSTIQDYITQTIATTAGERYFLSVQATTRTSANAGDKMILYADGVNLSSVTTTNAWVAYQANYVAASTSSIIRLISNGSVGGQFNPGDSAGLMVDDVQLQDLTGSPGAQTTAEDTAKVFSSANGNALQVATNTGVATLTVVLSVTNGTLTLSSTTGLTITSGANGTATMTFTGTATAINTALNAGLTYAPTPDFNGSSTLTFTATAGVSDTDTIGITVTTVADIVADSVSTIENSAIAFNAITGTNGASADNFEGSPIITAVGSASHGTVTFTAAGVITYTPTAGYSGTDTFTYTVTSGGVTETATETETIKALPRVTLTKISNGGVGGFTFTGTNGWVSQTITTVTSGTGVSGALQTLTATSTATTITETIPATFVLASVTCTGLGSGGTATPNLSSGALLLDAAATAAGSAISCTFTNTKLIPAMTVVKSANTAGPVSVGTVITYTFKVKNTGNTSITNVSLADTFNGNGTPPAPANEVLSLDVAPLSDSSNGTPNDGIWAVLGPGDEVTFTAPYTVTQADIDLLQ